MNLIYCKVCKSVFVDEDSIQFYNYNSKTHECPVCKVRTKDREDLVAEVNK